MIILSALLLVLVLVLAFRLRSFESSNLYFPTKTIDATPEDIGLAYEDLQVQRDGGETISCWMIPAEPSRGALLFCHGNAGNISHRLESIELFHRLNLTVLIFDYPGYGKSSGRPHETTLYDASETAYEFLQTTETPERCIIFGRSLGGAVAVELATRVPAAGLIVESCFTSTVEMGKEVFPFLPVKLIVQQKFDSLSKVANIRIPKLFVHSPNDDIIPYHHGEKLFEAAAEPKSFLKIFGDHNEGFLASGDHYIEGLSQFLDQVLPQEQ